MASRYDIEAIGREYRAGMLSIIEIARQHGCSDAYIHKLRKKHGWKRDLTNDVRKRSAANLASELVRIPDATDEEIVEAAAREQTEVRKLHRKDIFLLRAEEQRILKELGDDPKKLWVGQYKGEVVSKELSIAVTERAAALQALANVQHKRIQLERQAFGIDDRSGPSTDEADGFEIKFVPSPTREE